jgi:signal transduction histidine kinase
MGLSDFIAANADRIATECEVFARSLLPAAEGLDSEALRDHAKEMLMAIAADMKCPQTPDQQEEKSRGLTQALAGAALTAAQEHGDGRAAHGFTIIQTVAEFRALRAAALRLWLQTSPSLAVSHVDELIRFNEGVDQALAESVVRYAGAVARDRSQFLGVLSHELRTPLATILTSTRAQQVAAQHQRLLPEALDRTLRAGRHIQSILDDLLDYVRSGLRGGMRLTPSTFAMDQLCRNAIDNLLASHPGRRIDFSAHGDLEGVWDEDRIFQAMTNLIGNALKYGLPDLPVRVTASETDDGSSVVVEVHNGGPRIPPHTLESLFQPLVRGRGPDPSGVSLGLGLYVVREIAAAHGGHVGVESSDADTVFRLTLPRAGDGLRPSGFGHLGMN